MAFPVVTGSGPFLISLAFFIITLAYLFIILRLRTGWHSIPEYTCSTEKPLISISVIVAARDEQSFLPGLLHDLEEQIHPGELMEVIIADDHSVIPVSSLTAVSGSTLPRLKVVHLPDGYTGKKQALK